MCAVFDVNGMCYTGGCDGVINVWEDRDLKKRQKAHNGRIGAMACTDELIITGGADGMIYMWSYMGGLASSA